MLPIVAALAILPSQVPPASAAEALSIEEVEHRLKQCFVDGQYYVSGDLDRGIFAENCVFTDPTIKVTGTEKYASAVASIFSPETARADLITCRITSPTRIEVAWRLDGVITQAGRDFKFKPYTGRTVYTTDAATGRIESQVETWDISQLDVLVSLFWPSFGAPPAPPANVLRAAAGAAAA